MLDDLRLPCPWSLALRTRVGNAPEKTNHFVAVSRSPGVMSLRREGERKKTLFGGEEGAVAASSPRSDVVNSKASVACNETRSRK